jgi:hypothetical protein
VTDVGVLAAEPLSSLPFFLAKGCIYGTVLKGLSVYNAYRIASG